MSTFKLYPGLKHRLHWYHLFQATIFSLLGFCFLYCELRYLMRSSPSLVLYKSMDFVNLKFQKLCYIIPKNRMYVIPCYQRRNRHVGSFYPNKQAKYSTHNISWEFRSRSQNVWKLPRPAGWWPPELFLLTTLLTPNVWSFFHTNNQFSNSLN